MAGAHTHSSVNTTQPACNISTTASHSQGNSTELCCNCHWSTVAQHTQDCLQHHMSLNTSTTTTHRHTHQPLCEGRSPHAAPLPNLQCPTPIVQLLPGCLLAPHIQLGGEDELKLHEVKLT